MSKRLSDSADVWRKATGTPGATYYSPERTFVHLFFQQKRIRVRIFTRGEELEGIRGFGYDKGGARWGRMDLEDEKQLEHIVSIIEKSYGLIREAIEHNESTGWYAGTEMEDGEKEAVEPNLEQI